VACGALVLMAILPVLTFQALPPSIESRTIEESSLLDTAIAALEFAASLGSLEGGTTEGGAAPPSDKLPPNHLQKSEPAEAAAESRAAGNANGAPFSPRAGWLLDGMVVCWSVGVTLLSARLSGGWALTVRLRRRFVEPVTGAWQTTVERLARRLGIRGGVRLLESSKLEVPAAIGWLRPVVLLPAGLLTGLPADQLESILAHELAHIRRHDYLVNLVQSLIETLFFYHPGIWWISARIRTEREFCCDDLAVSACGNAATYARALAELEEFRSALPRPRVPRLAMAATGGELLRRIRRLVGLAPAMSSERWVAGPLALTVPVLLGTLWAWGPAWGARGDVHGEAEARRELARQLGVRQPPDDVHNAPPAADNGRAADRRLGAIALYEPLVYGWKPGASYVYSVTIEAEHEDHIETVTGNSTYTVVALEEGKFRLQHFGVLVSFERPRPGASGTIVAGFPRPPRLRPHGLARGPHAFPMGPLDRHELLFDERGRVLASTSENVLPYQLGDLSQLVIDPLLPDQVKGHDWHEGYEWHLAGDFNCLDGEQTNPFPHPHVQHPRLPFGGERQTTFPARRQTTYRLGKSENGLLEIAKQVDLSTHEQVGGKPRIRSVGGGMLLFNLEEKVPQSCEMTLTNSFESAGTTRRVAVKVRWKLLPAEDIEREVPSPAAGDASGPIETPNDE